MYTKLRSKSIKSLNIKDHVEIVVYQKYVETVSDIRYKWKIDDMIRQKVKAKNDI